MLKMSPSRRARVQPRLLSSARNGHRRVFMLYARFDATHGNSRMLRRDDDALIRANGGNSNLEIWEIVLIFRHVAHLTPILLNCDRLQVVLRD